MNAHYYYASQAVALARLTHNDIGIFWHIFKRWDLEKEGKITINDLFGSILGEERNMFSDSVLELLAIKEEEKVYDSWPTWLTSPSRTG